MCLPPRQKRFDGSDSLSDHDVESDDESLLANKKKGNVLFVFITHVIVGW